MILSTPIALKNILEHLSVWVNLICIGHAGSATVLGAAAFASSVNQLVGVSVAVALGRAVSTASSQAAGRSDHEALGLVLERALPLACAMALPIMALLCILPLFVRLLGMGEQFATLAGEYAIAILPVTAARGVGEVLQAWLACQKITTPPLYINLAMTPFHAAVCYSLVFNTRLGFLGAGCANSALWIARAATLYMYCISPHADLDRPFGGLTRRGLRDGRGELFRLVLPGVLMSDNWTGEAIMVCTGLVPNPAVALSALSVYTSTLKMIYDVPNGVRSGVTVCVGRALGAGLPSLASLAIRNGRLLLGCWLPLPLFAVCAFTSGWARIFTRDEAVILQLHALVPWLVVNSCAGGLMAIANAVMAGCKRLPPSWRSSASLALASLWGCSSASALG
ncbi:hypothetical protein EMIHUDRAFT_234658 [Emiliania huxleyi CCMP1516]|uniref:Uncharacterized protein n=2 Tax=Emiliania huxleyi TaxID=2903 RepID=A0A0D3JYW2_EMIH1|nr:hypothetical protein EMIHUDRAFT_234658 [Emiliania huxleyi CCMP1516]EOD28697.1 hypothetical protein EMIHUDRAFT_234658 [Emiliania huxleyi CCMP1516]|eukprot:XP_005781126.1 hypothetical protein EMIHUDRAFT_234658 [Emiliania huxleyi CCMP1516]